MEDCYLVVTVIRVRQTVYVPPPFVLILLTGELSPSKTWLRLRGALVTEKLVSDFWAVIEWLRVALDLPATNSLSTLLTSDPTAPLDATVLLKHRNSVLICDLPVLNPSVIRATGSLIATNIGDLVLYQRAVRIEAQALRKRKEDKGVETLL